MTLPNCVPQATPILPRGPVSSSGCDKRGAKAYAGCMLRALTYASALSIACATLASGQDICRSYADAGEVPGLRAILDAADPALTAFPYFRAALEGQIPVLCLDSGPSEARGFFDVEANRLVVSARLSLPEQLVIFLHELRHMQQVAEGFCPAPTLSMAENARAVFALEADAMAVTTLVAWTLREAGDTAPWQALSDWERYADIPAAFQEAIARGADDTGASAAAFYQWYDSDWRRESYYIAACSDYLDRQDASHTLQQYQLLPESYLSQLCRLPDGTGYPCAEPRDLSRP